MNSVFLDILMLLVIFVVSSLGSGWMMRSLGYTIPRSLQNREAMILVLMKITLMSIWVIVLIVILWLLGMNPLHL